MSLAMRKAELRRRVLARRRRLTDAAVRRLSRRIERRLLALPEFRLARTVCGYFGSRGEVLLDGLMADARRAGKRVAVPAWRARERCYGWREVTSMAACPVGRFGIREPRGGPWIDGEDADVVFVPGVAFDLYGNRIGHGAGFYDRLLAAMPRAVRVGVCHGFQVRPRLPAEAWDECVDVLACETGLVRVKR